MSGDLKAAVEKLAAEDPSEQVRFECMMAMMSHGTTIDLEKLIALIPKQPKESKVSYRLAYYFRQNKKSVGPGLRPLLAFADLDYLSGSDLLGGTSASQFRKDLDTLLELVSARGRQIVMFELPLFPLQHKYGRVQRDLAKKHQVLLIPRRVLMSVLSGNEATLDQVHLSEAGHREMADRVWKIVGPAFGEAKE